VFPSFGIGGAQSRLAGLAKAFNQRYRHTIVALDGCYDMAQQLPDCIRVDYRTQIKKASAPARILDIHRCIRAVSPDVLITHNWGSIEWAFTNRFVSTVPHIHIEDGFGPEERKKQFVRRILLRRLALSGSRTTVILPSRTLYKIASKQWRLPKNSLRFIPNGIDCARFDRPNRKYDVDAVVVGTVASLRPEKNLTRLIYAFAEACALCPQMKLRLVIVGDGPQRSILEQVALQSGQAEKIVFVGASEKPEAFFADMDIFGMSSDTEQMPLVLLEAMASGLPVFATDVGDIASLVSDGNLPYVTNLADTSALSRSLVFLAQDFKLRQRIGVANKAKAFAAFDQRAMVQSYSELFG